MNEVLHHGPEQHRPSAEQHISPERHQPSHEQIAAAERRQAAMETEMRQMTEALAQSAEDLHLRTQGEAKNQASPVFGLHNELKLQNYKRILSMARNRLSRPEKRFSRLIHSRPVDTASNAAAQTVARPIGLLTGGLFAFIGSLLMLWFARHYGFSYNFTAFIVLFAGGYCFGSLAELISRRVRH